MALPADQCTGRNYVAIRHFCDDLSLCPRGHSFRCGDTDYNIFCFAIFCFAERAHAEQFRSRFSGELIDPKDRPRWPGSHR